MLTKLFIIFVRPPFLLLWRLMGWRTVAPLPQAEKMIIVGAPHTSYWDYLHMLAAAVTFRRRPHVTMKAELFKGVVGRFVRAMGAIPVDRSKSTHFTEQIAERFDESERMVMIFTPEGTRSHTDYWRTGFYYTAKQADVPIVLACINYAEKQLYLSDLIYLSDDIDADFERIRDFYTTHGQALYPEKTGPIRRRSQREPKAIKSLSAP